MISRRRFLQGMGTAMLGAISAPAYAVGIEPFRLRIVHHHLTPPHWPEDLDLTAALIADPHVCDPWMDLARIRYIVEETNAQQPDIVLMLGDYVAGHRWHYDPIPRQAWADAFARFSAPLGIHAVLGNHDWWDDLQAQRSAVGPTIHGQALINAGIELYQNRAKRFEKAGKAFWLAGIDDQIALVPNRKLKRGWRGMDDLPGTLAQISDDAPVILMAHEPDIIREVPSRVSLTVSGHTHGGQINCFGYIPAFPNKPRRPSYVYGHIVDDGGTTLTRHLGLAMDPRHLIVSGGLGCSILPVRFGVPPEITMVHLGGKRTTATIS